MPGLSLHQLHYDLQSIHSFTIRAAMFTQVTLPVTHDWSKWPITSTMAEPSVVHPREFWIGILVLFCRECTSAENMKNEAYAPREAKMRNKEKFIVEFSMGQWGVKEVSVKKPDQKRPQAQLCCISKKSPGKGFFFFSQSLIDSELVTCISNCGCIPDSGVPWRPSYIPAFGASEVLPSDLESIFIWLEYVIIACDQFY